MTQTQKFNKEWDGFYVNHNWSITIEKVSGEWRVRAHGAERWFPNLNIAKRWARGETMR